MGNDKEELVYEDRGGVQMNVTVAPTNYVNPSVRAANYAKVKGLKEGNVASRTVYDVDGELVGTIPDGKTGVVVAQEGVPVSRSAAQVLKNADVK